MNKRLPALSKSGHKELAMSDIASKAGVCKATVSRALNTPERVSEATRNKVLAVVSEMGYTPNKLAAGLRQGKSRNIAIMLPDITNPYFSPVIRSIENVAHRRGYSVILNDTQDNPVLEKTFAGMVKTRQVDGIITNSSRIPFDIDPSLPVEEQLPPLVNASEFTEIDGIPKVGVDNYRIGVEATEHLLRLGHRQIGIIAGPDSINSSRLRETGFRDAMKPAGIPVDGRLLYHGDFSSQSGVEGVHRLMQQRNRPTAIFCFGDLAAIGAMHALRELEYCIPDDVSIISVDGIALGEYCAPPLTTIAQPMEAIGEKIAHILLDLIDGNRPAELLNILPHKLIVRKSTGPVPQP